MVSAIGCSPMYASSILAGGIMKVGESLNTLVSTILYGKIRSTQL